jgi:hypothetical protein
VTPTTFVVVGSSVIAAEAADGHGQLSIEHNYTPWFVWGFWLTIVAILTVVGFHLGRRFMADRRERGRGRPRSQR